MSKRATSKVTKRDLEQTLMDPVDAVSKHIIVVRGQRVMLDYVLAKLYGVTTKQLNQQLKRNRSRFPSDFAFQLTLAEAKNIAALRSQFVTLKRGQHTKHAPHVFTEHGAIMLANVLKSKTAGVAGVYVVRAFVKMRTVLIDYADLSRRIDELETKYDDQFQHVFDAIRALIALPPKPQRPIGFIGAPKKKAAHK